MTLALLDLDNGTTSPTPGPRWPKVVGALLVGAALLLAGPLRCTAPVTVPPREFHEDHFATDATTWSHSVSEGNAG